jgi:hypothetical protein
MDLYLSRYSRFDGQYVDIPESTQYALAQYVTEGQSVGGFLEAVLSNDLQGAFAHADTENQRELKNIVQWVYNVAPRGCWGGAEKVAEWMAHSGLKHLDANVPHGSLV